MPNDLIGMSGIRKDSVPYGLVAEKLELDNRSR